MARVPAVTDRSPIVIEFFGLPGAGKTTIANRLAEVLRKRGYEVRTAVDFIDWLAQQSKLTKLGFLISGMRGACRQLFWCTLFGVRLSPLSAISFSRIIRVPYINVCFKRYLDTLENAIVVMDQAGMQLVWSIGAFSVRHNKKLLHRACGAITDIDFHYFVSLTPNVEETAKRLQARKSNDSRFDALENSHMNIALDSTSSLITEIREFLSDSDHDPIDIDSTILPDENADRLASLVNAVLQHSNADISLLQK